MSKPASQQRRDAFQQLRLDPDGAVRVITDTRTAHYGRHLWGVERRDSLPIGMAHMDPGDKIWTEAQDPARLPLSCPAALFSLCPVAPSPEASDWRARVMAHNASVPDVSDIALGAIVLLAYGQRAVITQCLRAGSARTAYAYHARLLDTARSTTLLVQPAHIRAVETPAS